MFEKTFRLSGYKKKERKKRQRIDFISYANAMRYLRIRIRIIGNWNAWNMLS